MTDREKILETVSTLVKMLKEDNLLTSDEQLAILDAVKALRQYADTLAADRQ